MCVLLALTTRLCDHIYPDHCLFGHGWDQLQLVHWIFLTPAPLHHCSYQHVWHPKVRKTWILKRLCSGVYGASMSNSSHHHTAHFPRRYVEIFKIIQSYSLSAARRRDLIWNAYESILNIDFNLCMKILFNVFYNYINIIWLDSF